MKKGTGLILIGAGAAVCAGVAAYTSKKVTKTLLNAAFDREETKIVKAVTEKFMDSYEGKEPYKSAYPLIEVLENTPMESLEISSDDGLSLVGHWYPCENAKRVVIAMHGWRSTWARDFCAVAPFLHECGCSVLFCEQRGQGNSGGDYMGFGMVERRDCVLWTEKVCEMTQDIPVYLMGISMGAATVLMASGLPLPERVHGIISDCAFTSAMDIFKKVTEKDLHLSYALRKNDIEAVCRQKLQAGTEEYTTVDALKINTRPVLFIHGTDDNFVPVSMTYENYKACAAPKKLFVVPGADHGASYLIDKEGYERECLEFFEKYD